MNHVIFQGYDLSYSDEAVFEIQLRSRESRYETKYKVVGNLEEAIKHYRSMIMEYGDRKRIVIGGAVLVWCRA